MSKRVATGIYLVGRLYRAQAPKVKGSNANHRENFESLDDAIRWRGAAKAAVDRGEPIPDAVQYRRAAESSVTSEVGPVHLVRDVADSYYAWFERERSHKVTYRYLRTVRRIIEIYVIGILGDRDIRDVSDDDAYAVRDALVEKGLQERTAERILKVFRFVYRHAIHHGFADRDPFKYVEAIQPPRAKRLNKWAGKETPYQSLADVKRLSDRLGGVFAAIVWLQRVCALRISEALGIALGDVNWSNGWVTIHAQGGHLFRERDDYGDWVAVDRTEELKTPSSERQIVLPPILLRQLTRHVVDVYGVDPRDGDFDPDAPLLVSKVGQVPRLRRYYLDYAAARIAVGLDPDIVGFKRTGHDDRAFANTDLARDGVVHVLVRNQFLGHEPEVEPGASKAGARFYLGFRRFEPEMVKIAAYFDTQIRAQLGDDAQLVGDVHAASRKYDGFTMAEFCQLSGIPRSTAWAYVDRGDLPCERREVPNREPEIVISAADAYAFLETCSEIWTMHRAAEDVQVSVATLTYWLRHDQIVGTKIGKYWILDIDSVRKRAQERQRFVGHGISQTEAGRLLNSTPTGIAHLVTTGALVSAGSDGNGRVRVTRDSVMKYRKKLLDARGCERLDNGRLGRRNADPYAYRRRHVVKSAMTDT